MTPDQIRQAVSDGHYAPVIIHHLATQPMTAAVLWAKLPRELFSTPAAMAGKLEILRKAGLLTCLPGGTWCPRYRLVLWEDDSTAWKGPVRSFKRCPHCGTFESDRPCCPR